MAPASDDSSDSDESEDRRFLPQSHKGWQGENLELDHQRESIRQHKTKATSAAVDISQFQNHEVGKGYQAKHVIRQQVASQDTVKIKDMTGDKKKRKKEKRQREKTEKVDTPKAKVQKYLSSPGLILFRGEIEDILKS
ncbi:expressed unknown protein [Seminavis robusta]|uniref:Uncharacterized protein n=1 Tax=Seminavis robusta TaxID=568900 RepID=A0A9N8HZ58_9STRA|nr:expressed unknown protein [Seminavis robusta]|eukprot:Sro3297_g346320.1 n/a (138) ;mRNA; f:2838-3251